MKLSLAKALLYKKRVEQEVARRKTAMISTGEHTQSQDFTEDRVNGLERTFAENMESWNKVKSHLVHVKRILNKASDSLREDIFVLSELKDSAATIPTIPGYRIDKVVKTPKSNYSSEKSQWFAFKEDDKSKMVKGIERSIDDLQSKIDAFNHATQVEIEDFAL